MKSSKNIVVIGGGYTGLATAAELVNKGFSVTLIEKNNELGGLGRTIKLTNGFSCEAFYHHFFTHDKELLEYTNRFLKKNPTFYETKMAIFFKGKKYFDNQ